MTLPPGLPQAFNHGLVPMALFIAAFVVLYALLTRQFQASRLESVQAVFVFLAVEWVILTATCVIFRGEGISPATFFDSPNQRAYCVVHERCFLEVIFIHGTIQKILEKAIKRKST